MSSLVPDVGRHLSILDYDKKVFFSGPMAKGCGMGGGSGHETHIPMRRTSCFSGITPYPDLCCYGNSVRVRLWALIMKFEVCSRLPKVTVEHLIGGEHRWPHGQISPIPLSSLHHQFLKVSEIQQCWDKSCFQLASKDLMTGLHQCLHQLVHPW